MLRRTEAWRTPVDVLTLRQRRELVQQVRGRVPVVSGRLPLVRARARLHRDQRTPLVLLAAVTLKFVGMTVREPAPWRLAAAGTAVAFFVVALLLGRREATRARRFLDDQSASGEVGP